jgi:hypothetical protein
MLTMIPKETRRKQEEQGDAEIKERGNPLSKPQFIFPGARRQ